jgi:hypothetical protein
MTLRELIAQIAPILPDARFWQDNDGELCIATRFVYPGSEDEPMEPFSEEV